MLIYTFAHRQDELFSGDNIAYQDNYDINAKVVLINNNWNKTSMCYILM